MELDPKALSDDGYIIDQRQTESISFGGCPSSKNGCGWIAAYNFLKALDRTPNPEVLHELRRQKVPLEFALRPFHAQELAQRNRAGIVLYRAGKTNHFAAFARQPDGTLRFFGAVPGYAHHNLSMAEFYWDYVKFPLTLTITAK